MALGHLQMQFFMSMLAIAGAACVALICDFLRRKDEELREQAVELNVPGEDDQKLRGIFTPEAAPWEAARKQRSVTSSETVRNERKRTANADALAAMQRGEALARTGVRPATAPRDAAKKDWGSMLGRGASRTRSAAATLPEGFQEGYVLRKLVERRSPITGLVLSIGVNESADSVRGLVESLIGPHDFAAQSREDEFLLIYPEERGASAQRKLSEIAGKVRDLQFSWGGVEVSNEPIDEAIASASERMRATKRNRRSTASVPPAATDPVCRDEESFPKL